MKVTITFETKGCDFWTVDRLTSYYKRWIEEWLGRIDNDAQKLEVTVEH